MAASAGRQTVLVDFGFGPSSLLDPQTDPPTYLFTNDLPTTTQTTLDRWLRTSCPFCNDYPENREKHLLEAHPAEVSEFISERAKAAQPAIAKADGGTVAATPEPVMFGEVEIPDHNGQPLEPSDPRVCDECGTRKSADYARVFGHEDGTLYCPDCKPRSERYTNDPTYGPDHESDPATVTGSSNARSHANPHAGKPT